MPIASSKFENWNIWMGATLLFSGFAMLIWLWSDFEQLPNYLRIASLIPVSLAFPFFSIKQYAQWEQLSTIARWRLARVTIPPVLLFVGAMVWLLVSPETRG